MHQIPENQCRQFSKCWHYNKNTDGLVNRLANQAHMVAWLFGQKINSTIYRRTG